MKLQELGGPLKPPTEEEGKAPPMLAQQRLEVRMFLFDRSAQSLATALEMLDTGPIHESRQKTWAANGLRIGTLDATRLPLLLGNLPKPLKERAYTIRNAQLFVPLTLNSNVRSNQLVRQVDEQGLATNRRYFSGEFQLLLKVKPPLGMGSTSLDLLPHYYSPVGGIVERPEQERLLDGSSYRALRVAEPIAPGRVWVITATPPAQDDEPAAEKQPPQPRSNKLVTLGEAMMTGPHRGSDAQLLLILRLEEDAPSP